ncbi:hypothetical protein OHC33_004004 [Knufia fluminis]|uniref:P-loop containing nucleoside triphosphate hydrolase protein n=1 Tax=Knufia fluminis TaxID=191047 RepID=A0AAN8I5C9_9EURO|nr:hypothetical protein OHC33_004004 [Knufia fluminis]
MPSNHIAQALSEVSSPPPVYTRTVADVNILVLGSPGTGKSTFLSRLPQVHTGPVTSSTPLKPFDLENRPFSFSVSLFRRPYTFHIWPSTGTLFTDSFPDEPHFVIITYDVTSRASLHNAQFYWRKQFMIHFDAYEHGTPVMLLGLKRDLRTERTDEEGNYVCVMPQEGVKAASDMRCDKYAECSALTGELLWEAVEDITKVAARTTTEKGGLSEGTGCALM